MSVLYNILVSKEELDLDKTLDSGQAFRWRKTGDYWFGVIKDILCVLKQHDNCIETNVPVERRQILIDYFNLDMNYTDTISKLDLDKYALDCYNISKGIHILRQDYFETMVTFLMSSCNTMVRIRSIVNGLCKTYGNKLETEFQGIKFEGYKFPTIDALVDISESDFAKLGMGYRDKYLVSMVSRLHSNQSILDNLISKINGDETDRIDSVWVLNSFNGVGPKVSNCISLFAGHHLSAFPIDTHINRIINREYNGFIDLKRFGNIAGIIQQYMFYSEAFKYNSFK